MRDPAHDIAQLQAGADKVKLVLQSCPTRLRLLPVLVCNRISSIDRKAISARRITLGKQSRPILVARCGAHLDEILS